MRLDSMGRRARTGRQPRGERHHLTKRDIKWLAFIHRHGGRLPTSYIHNYLSSHHNTPHTTQRRLKVLFQELAVLDRPWQQLETIDPRYNELVHSLSPKGEEVLKDEGLYFDLAPSPHGAFKHQVMLSCISASFELAGGFIPQHTILEGSKGLRVDLTNDTLIPDEVFGIPQGDKQLLVFLEVDRGTEVTETRNFNRKSWTRTIRQYRELIGHRKYKDWFHAEHGAVLLIVTVTKAKMEGILKVIAQEFPNGCNYILVGYMPEFGRIFHPPKVLDVSRPWKRYKYPDFYLTNKN